MNEHIKDVIVRAVKTFVQAFLAFFVPSLIAYLNGYSTDLSVRTVLYPALAAGISAVWNLLAPPKGVRDGSTNSE